MAVEQCHVPAQYDLEMLLVMGDGVIPNYVQAYAWFSLAASAGHVLAQGLPERAAVSMTSDEIAEAQKLMKEWAAKQKAQ